MRPTSVLETARYDDGRTASDEAECLQARYYDQGSDLPSEGSDTPLGGRSAPRGRRGAALCCGQQVGAHTSAIIR